MKKRTKLFSVLTVLALAIALMATAAFADSTVNGTTEVTFDKYVTMNSNANVPNASFTFAITPGTPVAAVIGENARPAVMAGPNGALLTYGDTTAQTVTVPFAPGDDTFNTVQEGDTVNLGANQKYAVKTVTVDLTGVTFAEPGIYRYAITETAANDGVSNDTVTTRYLDIYIDSTDSGDLSIQGAVLHNTTEVMAAAGGVYTAKDGGFQNDYTTYDLTIAKEVTGNQGFRGKYFAFTLDISNAVPGTKYTVDLTDAEASAGGHTNPPEIIVGENGTAKATFYLKDGQSVIIRGLTAKTAYVVSEDAEDYTPSYVLDGNASVDGNSTPLDVIMGESSHAVEFTNYRNGVIPTGIMLDLAPYVFVILLAGAAAVLLLSKKRSRNSR